MKAKLRKQLLAELGKEGARARANKLTPERRKEIARNAAAARWSRVRKGGQAVGKKKTQK